MKDSLRSNALHKGQGLTIEVWAAGLDESDPDNKQYKFGMQIIQIPMSGMLRFDAHFIHDQFGNSINLNTILPSISKMIQNHTEAFINGRVPQELCAKWLTEAKGQL